jgi:hypothetical protein
MPEWTTDTGGMFWAEHENIKQIDSRVLAQLTVEYRYPYLTGRILNRRTKEYVLDTRPPECERYEYKIDAVKNCD